MPLKSVWLNIPCKDVNASKEFFVKLGFGLNSGMQTEKMSCLKISKGNFICMLCNYETFEKFAQVKVADTKVGAEVLISMDCETREEVDELAEKAKAAGANVFAPPGEYGGIYGFAFADLDGHRWNLIHM